MTPGDQLRIEVDVLAFRGTAGRLQGKAYVEGKLVCEAVVTCRLLTLEPAGTPRQPSPNPQAKRRSPRMNIHPTAVIDPAAKIPASCRIGPYCVVHAGVELGENCELISHVVLDGPSRFGSDNRILSLRGAGHGPAGHHLRG